MDMDYMDPFRRRYPGLPSMQPFAVQQQPHPQSAQYPYWNPLMAYYQQQHRAAALMVQGNMQLSKPAEPKPRLAKDEVELLEREFAKNQKPSSGTKRELAEQMGVEVPRINNWFQNRRAKEKQIKKTAEFEAQQARERAASETQSTEGQDQHSGGDDEPAGQCPPEGFSTAPFGRYDGDAQETNLVVPKTEPVDDAAPTSVSAAPGYDSPGSSDSDGFVHVDYDQSARPTPVPASLTASGSMVGAFGEAQGEQHFQQPAPAFSFRLADASAVDGPTRPAPFDALTINHDMGLSDTRAFSPLAEQDYFATPSASQFPSEMVASNSSIDAGSQLLRHQPSIESLAHSDVVSPLSMPDSPSTVSNLRFKSPPPPADIAGRRKSRRPAPLGLSSLRGASGGPKTGIEVPRRADTVSPMRRISSATGLYNRVQKSFMASGGPRSPFAMDRNKEALLQSLHESQTPSMSSLNTALPPLPSEGMLGSGVGDCAVGASPSDDEQGYPFGSLGPVSGLPLYHSDATVHSPPGTPSIPVGFQEAYFPTSLEHPWNYAPHDEPLPTPSLCSHGGSEVEFSMAPHLPGYVASQPVTPSFPPTMGPAYAGFFGTSLGQAEYHFPDSYHADSSARSSPVAPPRSKQFQFAQNITPQDFNTDKS